MTLTDRDIQIQTAVAFKEAARFYDGRSESLPLFLDSLTVLNEALVAEIERSTAAHASTPAPQSSAPGYTPQADNNEGGIATVEVIVTKNGGQQGPLPAWFIADAAKKGVTKVFDNRARLGENAKLPWFKSPEDQGGHAFWPPR